jgi:hypothetical protein
MFCQCSDLNDITPLNDWPIEHTADCKNMFYESPIPSDQLECWKDYNINIFHICVKYD